LTIVGGGDEYDMLIKKIESLGLSEKAKVTGMVSKEKVLEYMLSSDLYVMTSLTECFPMVLLEASSVGLPLVSFDVPVGPKAIIENGKNGYLIEDKKVGEMADRIVDLLKNREELTALGRRSKEMASRYLPENVMPLWHRLFK
ncbi:MAG: glycosyltransferase, partial [Clostridia bacterium]|nr:glycosyltransferase [Clostridia bacterium]